MINVLLETTVVTAALELDLVSMLEHSAVSGGA